jgi:two-component system OmpR family sensor kinase
MNLRISHSLRARLLWFLLVAVVLTAVTQAAIAYRAALAEADDLFDFQMRQMAMSLRPGFPVGGQPDVGAANGDEDNFDFVIQVWTANGLRVFQSTTRAELPQRAVLGFSTIRARGTTYRLYSFATNSQVIQVAQDVEARRQMAGTLALRTVSPMLALVPLLMLLVWWVVTMSLAPVKRVQRQVAARQADDLDELSEDELPDEIKPLVHELNLLFQRVTQAFDAQKNFVADAAHELRSPLAALKLQVQALRRAANDDSRDIAINRLGAGIDRAARLIEQLLILARQQSNSATGAKPESVELAATAQLVVSEMAAAAKAKEITVSLKPTPPCSLSGYGEALRILVRNLLDNAIKYTPVGGTIHLNVLRQDKQIFLTVEDSGPGVAPQDRSRILDRFYRVAGSGGTGSGLGLAIVKTIADVHRASVFIEQSGELGGLCVKVVFPAA